MSQNPSTKPIGPATNNSDTDTDLDDRSTKFVCQFCLTGPHPPIDIDEYGFCSCLTCSRHEHAERPSIPVLYGEYTLDCFGQDVIRWSDTTEDKSITVQLVADRPEGIRTGSEALAVGATGYEVVQHGDTNRSTDAKCRYGKRTYGPFDDNSRILNRMDALQHVYSIFSKMMASE